MSGEHRYGDIAEIRRLHEALAKKEEFINVDIEDEIERRIAEAVAAATNPLIECLQLIEQISSGEEQVALDDTEALGIINAHCNVRISAAIRARSNQPLGER